MNRRGRSSIENVIYASSAVGGKFPKRKLKKPLTCAHTLTISWLKVGSICRHITVALPHSAMCFPFKKQKDNFNDAPAKGKSGAASKSTAPASAAKEAPLPTTTAAPATAATTEPTTQATPSATEPTAPAAAADAAVTTAEARKPKIGIIIYTMYGHVAKRECRSMGGLSYIWLTFTSRSGRGGEGGY
jgi:hypothetical protein